MMQGENGTGSRQIRTTGKHYDTLDRAKLEVVIGTHLHLVAPYLRTLVKVQVIVTWITNAFSTTLVILVNDFHPPEHFQSSFLMSVFKHS